MPTIALKARIVIVAVVLGLDAGALAGVSASAIENSNVTSANKARPKITQLCRDELDSIFFSSEQSSGSAVLFLRTADNANGRNDEELLLSELRLRLEQVAVCSSLPATFLTAPLAEQLALLREVLAGSRFIAVVWLSVTPKAAHIVLLQSSGAIIRVFAAERADFNSRLAAAMQELIRSGTFELNAMQELSLSAVSSPKAASLPPIPAESSSSRLAVDSRQYLESLGIKILVAGPLSASKGPAHWAYLSLTGVTVIRDISLQAELQALTTLPIYSSLLSSSALSGGLGLSILRQYALQLLVMAAGVYGYTQYNHWRLTAAGRHYTKDSWRFGGGPEVQGRLRLSQQFSLALTARLLFTPMFADIVTASSNTMVIAPPLLSWQTGIGAFWHF